MSRTIYKGPNGRQPVTTDARTVNGALLPCTFVTETATQFNQATAPGPNVRLLANRDFYSVDQLNANDPLLTAYATGETGVAYILEPGQRYLVAAAAATYTFGQALTVAAAGRVAGASTGNVVVAFSRQAGTLAAGALLEVEIANFYAQA